MNEWLTTDLLLIICEGVMILFLIINSFHLRKRNKKTEELVALQMNRIREDNLDASLRNTMYMQHADKVMNNSNPYDVKYHQEEKNVYDDTREKISIQVEEKGILSTKKYVVHVFDTIGIGSADENEIILKDLTLSRRQVQLMRVEKDLFVKNLDCSYEVQLLRGKKSTPLMEEAICMKTEDTIILGNTSLKIVIV